MTTMITCSNCQAMVSINNSYTLQKKNENNFFYLCEKCLKNSFKDDKERFYMACKYSYLKKGNDTVITEPIQKATSYFECDKCCVKRDCSNSPSKFDKGCPNCQSKNFEIKKALPEGDLHYIGCKCPTCHKVSIACLVAWPESDATKGKPKPKIVGIIRQKYFNNQDIHCQCKWKLEQNSPSHHTPNEPNNSSQSDNFDWKRWIIVSILILFAIIIFRIVYRKLKRK